MRGNIEQRGDNRWWPRVFAGREEGRTTFVTRSFRGTKPQAETALARLVSEVEAGRTMLSHATSVADQLDAWLTDITLPRSPYTVKGAPPLHRARHQAGARPGAPRHAGASPAVRPGLGARARRAVVPDGSRFGIAVHLGIAFPTLLGNGRSRSC
jgi:hypothetical protein